MLKTNTGGPPDLQQHYDKTIPNSRNNKLTQSSFSKEPECISQGLVCREPHAAPHMDCVQLSKKAQVNKAQPTALGLTPHFGFDSPADMQQTLAYCSVKDHP